MNTNVKLSDFEPRQINLLTELIEERMLTIERTKMEAELEDGDVSRIIKKCDEDLNDFMLWKVQLANAKQFLKQIETTHQ